MGSQSRDCDKALMSTTDQTWLELLYLAMSKPLGVVIASDDTERALGRLSAARQRAGDPALACLAFYQSRVDPAREIWIIKKAAPTTGDLGI